MAVSKRLRFEILRRDNHACRYCGRSAPDVALTVDHVVAVALGGSDDPSNLVAACRDCNSGKSSVPADAALVANVDQDALRWAAAIQRAAELAQVDRDQRVKVERAVWAVFEQYEVPSYRGGGTLADRVPGNWFESIDRFLGAGLVASDLIEAAFIAAEARGVRAEDTWRYFCGVCNRKIKDLQEAAAQLIVESEPAPAPTEPEGFTSEIKHALWSYYQLSNVCDRGPLTAAGLL